MTKYRTRILSFRPAAVATAVGLAALTSACDDGGDRAAAGAAAEQAKQKAAGIAKDGSAAKDGVDRQALLAKVKPLLPPLPEMADNEANPWTKEKADLGRMLYYDTRLSKNHDMSCNTCHDLANFGIDPREKDGKRTATSAGHKGAMGARNSPTVYNAAIHFTQFWDGRAADVEEQAKGPVLNPVEMAMADEKAVVATLQSIPGYAEPFEAAFPDDADPITYDNMAKAIGAFERKLMTPSAYDEFLAGNLDALTDEQAHGLQTFVEVGCTTCHTGAGLGGGQFQKLGNVKPWPKYSDEGRAEVTKSAADKYMFKVPSLRNITKTAPYLHDGSIEDLETMVSMMAEHQLGGGRLEADKLQAILAFLTATEGKIPTEYIAKPEFPESGPKTPPPNPA